VANKFPSAKVTFLDWAAVLEVRRKKRAKKKRKEREMKRKQKKENERKRNEMIRKEKKEEVKEEEEERNNQTETKQKQNSQKKCKKTNPWIRFLLCSKTYFPEFFVLIAFFVCGKQVCKENAAKFHVPADRCDYIAGSAFEADLKGPYDVILLTSKERERKYKEIERERRRRGKGVSF
jgi:hypothetical protein